MLVVVDALRVLARHGVGQEVEDDLGADGKAATSACRRSIVAALNVLTQRDIELHRVAWKAIVQVVHACRVVLNVVRVRVRGALPRHDLIQHVGQSVATQLLELDRVAVVVDEGGHDGQKAVHRDCTPDHPPWVLGGLWGEEWRHDRRHFPQRGAEAEQEVGLLLERLPGDDVGQRRISGLAVQDQKDRRASPASRASGYSA